VAVIRGAYRRSMENIPLELPIPRTRMDYILRRIQKEFREMPGLRLTCRQAQRLWNLDQLVCESLLAALVDVQFLVECDGVFLQRTDAVASGMLRNADRFS
jgi:hypothetical protein